MKGLPKVSKEVIIDRLYQGFWALFFVTLAITFVIVIFKIDSLTHVAVHFQPDSYDTILSIEWMKDYGAFGNIPLFSDDYKLFGNWPLLYAYIGSIIDILLNNPSESMLVVYWATDILIAVLLYTRFLKKLDWKIRVLFVAFFLADIMFGNLFPLGYRRRQQLAILLGMLMFLTERISLQLALGFLALLAQPFAGAAMLALKGADFLDGRKYRGILLLLVPLLLAYPFYASLLGTSGLEPKTSGCSYLVQRPYPGMAFFLLVPFLAYYLANRKEFGFLEFASLGMLSTYHLSLLFFWLIRSFAPLNIAETFLHIFSLPCYDNLFNVAAFGLVYTLYRKGGEIPKATVASLIFIALISLNSVSFYLFFEEEQVSIYENMFDDLKGNNISNIKTLEIFITDYSGSRHYKPVWTLFPLQGYSLLYGKNITFVDNYNMPPQLSKGKTNLPMADLPSAIGEGELERCQQDINELESAGVEGLVFYLSSDIPDYNKTRFEDQGFLDGCGIKLLSNSSQLSTSIVVYELDER